MAYVKRLVGANEHLYGVARLHWIYITHGVFAMLTFMAIGWGIDYGFGRLLAAISGDVQKNISVGNALMEVRFWLWPACIIMGVVVFLMYFIKFLSTEIGLTDQRIIIKTGWIFVNVKEVDTMEVRGEHLDMGLFGEIFRYAYVNLDCKFIGDLRLPAIAKAENFVKAFHKIQLENEMVKSEDSPVKHRKTKTDDRDGLGDAHHYRGQKELRDEVQQLNEITAPPMPGLNSDEIKELALEKALAEKELMEAKLRIMELELAAARNAMETELQPIPTSVKKDQVPRQAARNDTPQQPKILPLPQDFILDDESEGARKGMTPELAADMAQQFEDAESGSVLSNAGSDVKNLKEKPLLH